MPALEAAPQPRKSDAITASLRPASMGVEQLFGLQDLTAEQLSIAGEYFPASFEKRPLLFSEQLLNTPLPEAAVPAIGNIFAGFVEENKRSEFGVAFNAVKTVGDAASVLKQFEIPQALSEKTQRLFEIKLPEEAKPTLNRIFSRYVNEDLKLLFEEDLLMSVTTVRDAIRVLTEAEVPERIVREVVLDTLMLSGKAAKKLEPFAWAIPVIITACGVPELTTPDSQVDIWGEFFRNHPEQIIMRMAFWGGSTGGILGILGVARTQIDKVFGHEHLPIHTGLLNIGIQAVVEFFENYIKTGAATAGLALTAGRVPVDNINFLSTAFFVGLFFQTISEFVTEPLIRLMTATKPPEEEHH